MTHRVRPPLRAPSGVKVGAPSCAHGGETPSWVWGNTGWGARFSPTGRLSRPHGVHGVGFTFVAALCLSEFPLF